MSYKTILFYSSLFVFFVSLVIGLVFAIIYILKPEALKKLKVTNLLNEGTTAIVDEKPPPPSYNGEYYDYSKLNIQPKISFAPPIIIDVPPIIKGSVISTTLASDEYNKNYRIFSGTDVATVITSDMMVKKYNELKPKVLEDLGTNDNIFEWKNDDKCYIPLNYIPEINNYRRSNKDGTILDSYIVLGECNKNNAKYKIINGYIQHIDTNKYLRPVSGLDNPLEYDTLILSNLAHEEITMKDEENKDQKLTFPTVFIKNKDEIEKMQFYYNNDKLIHKSSDYCVAPLCSSNKTISYDCNSKIALSLVDCEKLPK